MIRWATPAWSCSGASSGTTRVIITAAAAIITVPAISVYVDRSLHAGSRRIRRDNRISATGLMKKNSVPPTRWPVGVMLTPATSSRIGTAAATNAPMPVANRAAGPAMPALVGAMPRC